jgi:hypothetical protein
VLALNGNPIVVRIFKNCQCAIKYVYLIFSSCSLKLLPGYRGTIVDNLTQLVAFDDKPVTKEERINFLDFKLYSGKVSF